MSMYTGLIFLLAMAASSWAEPATTSLNNLNLSQQSTPFNGIGLASGISQDLQVAIAEMRAGTYHTFVTLVQMLGDRIPQNITFFMPNDEMLGQVVMAENLISEFLMRHSIPQSLVLNNMLHFPTGSLIPTNFPTFMLKVFNNGTRSFYINGVQIVSPDICRLTPSIRCHGISAVLNESTIDTNGRIIQDPSNSNSNNGRIIQDPSNSKSNSNGQKQPYNVSSLNNIPISNMSFPSPLDIARDFPISLNMSPFVHAPILVTLMMAIASSLVSFAINIF